MGEVALPVARVACDVPLPHLDRLFDYLVPPDLDAEAQPGVRVRVRFAGRLVDGFLVERLAKSEHARLAALLKVVSPEPVLTPEVLRLARAVADHYGGTLSDVLRVAVPPRHAATEKAVRLSPEPTSPLDPDPGSLAEYPAGPSFLAALRRGESPRAAWQVAPVAGPTGDWTTGLAAAAEATVESGRTAVLVVPDGRDVARLYAAVVARVGKERTTQLTADLGPAARYRAFLTALRGTARVVVGTRTAAFAPVPNLGLIALFDDGDDLHSEPRAPYQHAREVAALRASQTGAAVLLAAYARTAEIQAWIERDWLRPIELPVERRRRLGPLVRIAAATDRALERDPMARHVRMPREVFNLIRRSLVQGVVLVQVPRAGHLLSGGAARTADEFVKAFPGVTIRRSGGDSPLTAVPDEPAIVIATPGSEPRVEGGFAAAILLDTASLLGRPGLRAGEEALRRLLAAVALVRPGEQGGSVLAVGAPEARELQALVRLDPSGYAERELAERAQAGFPPATRLLTLEGTPGAIADFAAQLRPPAGAEIWGPEPTGEPEGTDSARLTLRIAAAEGGLLVATVRELIDSRAAAKQPAIRLHVDPVQIG